MQKTIAPQTIREMVQAALARKMCEERVAQDAAERARQERINKAIEGFRALAAQAFGTLFLDCLGADVQCESGSVYDARALFAFEGNDFALRTWEAKHGQRVWKIARLPRGPFAGRALDVQEGVDTTHRLLLAIADLANEADAE